MSELSLFDRLLECGCRPDVQEVCDLCQVIKPEVERLRAKLKAAEDRTAKMTSHAAGLEAELDRIQAAEAELEATEEELESVSHSLNLALGKRERAVKVNESLIQENQRLQAEVATERACRLNNEQEMMRADAEIGTLRTRIAELEAERDEAVELGRTIYITANAKINELQALVALLEVLWKACLENKEGLRLGEDVCEALNALSDHEAASRLLDGRGE